MVGGVQLTISQSAPTLPLSFAKGPGARKKKCLCSPEVCIDFMLYMYRKWVSVAGHNAYNVLNTDHRCLTKSGPTLYINCCNELVIKLHCRKYMLQSWCFSTVVAACVLYHNVSMTWYFIHKLLSCMECKYANQCIRGHNVSHLLLWSHLHCQPKLLGKWLHWDPYIQ